MKKRTQADLLLLLTTMVWGTSYLLTKIGLGRIEPFNLTALRFVIAFFVAVAAMPRLITKFTAEVLKYGAILGVILYAIFATMTYGVMYTSTSNAGFLIGLAIVIVPCLSWILFKKKPQRKVLVSISIATVGIALLTLDSHMSIGFGDALCLLTAFTAALHLVMVDYFTKKVDSLALAVAQIGFVGAFSLLTSLLIETPKLPSTQIEWVSVLGLSILCTAFGLIAQVYAQQFTSPSRAVLIFSLESVFAAFFGFIFLGEVLLMRGYIGAALMVTGVLITELDLSALSTVTRRKPLKKAG